MARRSRRKSIKRWKYTLANGEVATRNGRAHMNSADGLVYADPNGVDTMIPFGLFLRELEGDGLQTVEIEFFEEIWVHGWANDTGPNAVTPADLFSIVHLKGGDAVTTDTTADAPAGRVFALENNVVYVRSPL